MKLTYDELLSNFAINCNLRHYTMGEVLGKDPLFQGKTEIDQIDRIFRLLGTPNDKIWPEYSSLPSVKKVGLS